MKIKGYLQQKNGKWYYRLKWTDENGKKHDTMRKGGKSKKETNEIMAAVIKDMQSRSNKSNILFGAVFDLYINNCKNNGCKQSTIVNYSNAYNKHLYKLGGVHVADLRALDLIKVLDDCDNNNTATWVYKIFKILYRYAYSIGIVDSLTLIERFKAPKKPAPKYNNMTIEDFKLIVNYVYERRDNYRHYLLYCYIVLMAELGTRRGELCGLTWDCVDMTNKCVVIKHNLTVVGADLVITTPKTATSERVIYFSDVAYDVFVGLWQKTVKNRLFLSGAFNDDYNAVFRWENGEIINPMFFYAKFRYVQIKLGFSKLYKLHDLRHLNASILIAGGLDVIAVQSRLGHTNASTTLNIYSHILKDKQEEAVKVLDDALKFR